MRSISAGALVERTDDDDRSPILPARAGYIGAWQRREMVLGRLDHRVGEARVVGDQDRLGERIVLGLRQQVGRDPGGIVSGVGDDQDFGGAGDQVDPHLAEQLTLCLGHPGVAGPGDLVDRTDRPGPPGERRDRLRPADPPDLTDPGDRGGREHQGRDLAARRGHRHRNPFHAGDPGGNGVHQHGARIGRRTARDVKPDGVERRPARPETHPRRVDVGQRLRHLADVKGRDALLRRFQGLDQGRRAVRPRGFDFIRRHPQGRNAFRLETVQSGGVTKQRPVAVLANVGDDARRLAGHVGLRFAGARQQRVEIVRETRLRAVEPSRHRARPGTGRSSD